MNVPNAPRCQVGNPQCRSQAAGFLTIGEERVAICEDDWIDIGMHDGEAGDPLAAWVEGNTSWQPLLPDLARAGITRRLAMYVGAPA